MGNRSITRRPISNSDDERLVNYTPVTSIYTKNSVYLTRHSGGLLDGKIDTVEINDDHVKKTLTFIYSGSTFAGFSTVVEII